MVIVFGALALLVVAIMCVGLSGIGSVERDDQAVLSAASRLPAEQRIAVERTLGHAEAQLASTRAWLEGLGAVALVLSAVAFVSLRRGIVGPLNQAILIAETVAAGDLSQEFTTDLRGDFGRLLGALGTMEDTLTDLVEPVRNFVCEA
ncbi:methyl-accepting chemotaxis protein [Xylophilus sp.]|uniref:methyl-accepting chemotaxis protein n=1 Tax=Xylophilus sp. TaxID=2653893 RepID=UPI002D7E2C85|nr:methyl-accepting chemotaxis protein [Xylophilus sp.]